MPVELNKISKNKKTLKKENKLLDFLNKDVSLGTPKFSDKNKEVFFSDLCILLQSGIDIQTALDLVVDDFKKDKDRAVIISIQKFISEGNSLYDSMQKTNIFSLYEVNTIMVGEESGRLTIVLSDLAAYYAKKMEQRRKIVNALTYPIIVLFIAIGAVFFMLTYIVPMFQDVFKQMNNAKLPSITLQVIAASDFLKANFLNILFCIVVIVIITKIFSKNEKYKQIKIYLSFLVPVYGDILKKMYITRFCLTMELLTGANIPLVESIKMTQKMIDFYPLQKALLEIEKDIIKGVSLSDSMSKHKIFDKRVTSLIKVGEEVNQLHSIFGKIKQQYSNDTDYLMGRMSSILEPAIILFVGLFVGVILVSMYLPMFKLNSSFGQ